MAGCGLAGEEGRVRSGHRNELPDGKASALHGLLVMVQLCRAFCVIGVRAYLSRESEQENNEASFVETRVRYCRGVQDCQCVKRKKRERRKIDVVTKPAHHSIPSLDRKTSRVPTECCQNFSPSDVHRPMRRPHRYMLCSYRTTHDRKRATDGLGWDVIVGGWATRCERRVSR